MSSIKKIYINFMICCMIVVGDDHEKEWNKDDNGSNFYWIDYFFHIQSYFES